MARTRCEPDDEGVEAGNRARACAAGDRLWKRRLWLLQEHVALGYNDDPDCVRSVLSREGSWGAKCSRLDG